MKSARRRPMTSRTGGITGAPATPDLVADGKLTKPLHLAHTSLSPSNMSLRTKRLLEQDQEGSIVKKKCTSLMSDSFMKVPVVRLNKLELDHQKRKLKEPTPDDGSVNSKLSPSPVAHNELLASNRSSANNQQQNTIENNACTSPPKECSKVPAVRLFRLNMQTESEEKEPTSESDREKHRDQEPTPDDGSVHSKLPPSPIAHNELLASNRSSTNNHQQPNTIENNVCTSPPKECSKVLAVRLFRLNMPTESEEKEPTSESDREKHRDRVQCDQELQKTDQQKVPCATNSYRSLEGICRRKQPVVKLSRLKAQLEGQLGESSSEQYLDPVPSPSNTEADDGVARSPLAQNAILSPNTDFTRKHDQQDGDSASPETVCLKQAVVHLTRLNIETKNQCQATDEDDRDSEHHHDHVQSMPPESQDEQPTDDSDSDQLDAEELKMLSAYELERLKNIKANAKFLKSLKLLEIPGTLRRPPRKRPCVIRVKSQSDLVMRRSMRLHERTLPIKIPEKKKEIEVLQEQQLQPHGAIKMCPSNDVDPGAWISFQDTWKSISKDKCAKPSRGRKLASYTKSLQSLTLKKRAVTRAVPGYICSLAIHPSKTRTLVAAGDNYGNVGLWDLKHQSDGVYVFPLHSKMASYVAFSPSNPQHLLSLGREGTIRCGDISCSVFDEIYYEEGYLTSFDFLSADGSVLLVSHRDSKLSVVDRRTRNTSYEVRGLLDFKYVRSVNVHPLKRDLCVVAGSSKALIYDVRKLSMKMTQPVMSLLGHGNRVLSASFSPVTGRRILTSSVERRLRVFKPHHFEKDKLPAKTFRFNKKGSKLPVVTWDPKQDKCFGHGLNGGGQIDILCADGQFVHTLASTFSLTPTVLAIHPTRDLVVTGTCVGVVGAWKKWNNKEKQSLE